MSPFPRILNNTYYRYSVWSQDRMLYLTDLLNSAILDLKKCAITRSNHWDGRHSSQLFLMISETPLTGLIICSVHFFILFFNIRRKLQIAACTSRIISLCLRKTWYVIPSRFNIYVQQPMQRYRYQVQAWARYGYEHVSCVIIAKSSFREIRVQHLEWLIALHREGSNRLFNIFITDFGNKYDAVRNYFLKYL